MRVFTFFFLSCALILLSSCTCQRLTIQSEYLGRESLASYYVNTPDPLLDAPPIGQRLIIGWSIPKSYLAYSDLHLHIIVRLRNREQDIQQVLITDIRGTHLYELLNEKFCQSGGILTYKVTLIGNGCLLEEWHHPLWTDLITFDL